MAARACDPGSPDPDLDPNEFVQTPCGPCNGEGGKFGWPDPLTLPTVANITAELLALGVDASLAPTMLQAVDKAGYEVAPTGGGSAVPVWESLPAACYPVAGIPGLFVIEVTLPDTSKVVRLSTAEEIAKGVRVPSGAITDSTMAGATEASRRLIACELDTLRVPLASLALMLEAIENAGYELSAKTTGDPVASSTPLAAATFNVAGYPGLWLISVTMPDASVVSRVVTDLEWLRLG